MHDIIDAALDVGEYAEQLASAGVKTVIRYYNHRNSNRLPTKAVTKRELDRLFGAGVSVGVVFQQRGGAGGNLGDFSPANGRRDSARALELANNVGQPTGSAVYFSVDHDFYRPAEIGPIQAYFQEIRTAFAGRYRVGVYGSGTVGRTLKLSGAVDLVWLAAARGWSGTRQMLQSGQWVLDQRFLELRSPIGGFIYDGNVFNPEHADFGQFGAKAALETDVGEGTAALYEVIARRGLNLRALPVEGGRWIESLPMGTVVRGLEREGNWLKVDLNGDGMADGYMSAPFLDALSGGLPLSLPVQVRPIDVARSELALDVRQLSGKSNNNPRVTMYHATTKGGPAPDETAWGSAFVNYCVQQAGLSGTRSKWARSWHDADWGQNVTDYPEEGDIVIWRRRGDDVDGGHVAFYLDADDQSLRVLGGNQGRAVSIRRYPRNGRVGQFQYDLLSIRRG